MEGIRHLLERPHQFVLGATAYDVFPGIGEVLRLRRVFGESRTISARRYGDVSLFKGKPYEYLVCVN